MLKLVNNAVLLALFCDLAHSEQEEVIGEVVPIDKLSTSALPKNAEIRAGGTFTDEYRIQDYGKLYAKKQNVLAAKRDFSEGAYKGYGMPNGAGPDYPGAYCMYRNEYTTIIIWPTVNCKRNLKSYSAFALVKADNETLRSRVANKCEN